MYLNRTNDVLFKYLFGRPERKTALLSFVNSVLSGGDQDIICDLELVDRELNAKHLDDKAYQLDILGKTPDGTIFEIEVQTSNKYDIDKRTLCYWGRLYDGQLTSGALYRSLRPVIMINLLTFSFFPEEKYLSHFKVMDCESKRPLNEDLQIYFLELPKWDSLSRKAKNRLERWLVFLSNKNPYELEEIAMRDPVIQSSIEEEKKFLSDEAARYLYDMRERFVTDQLSGIASARAEGLKAGREEGREEEKLRIARAMILSGMEPSKVAAYTELSGDQLRRLMAEQ